LANKTYTFADAQRLTGVQRGHLARWVERGIITADLGGGGISGAHRKFSFRNIFEIALAVELQRFRVHHVFIRGVLASLRAFDPDTVTTADIPANRPWAFDLGGVSALEGLTPSQRKRRLAQGNRRDFIAPDILLAGLKARLESSKDTNEKRWNRFKRPDTRGDMLGFVVLNLLPSSAPDGFSPWVSFLSTLNDDFFRAGITTIVIDAKHILMPLEMETGDRL